MGERYWITGIQLGLLQECDNKPYRKELIEEIIDKQFIGNFESDKDKERFEEQIKKVK